MELVILAALAFYGIGCTAALVALLAARDAAPEPPAAAPEKLEPPDLRWPAVERYPAATIFPIMAEHFPDAYERYRSGGLGYRERRGVWEACCSIHDARAEIEEICS